MKPLLILMRIVFVGIFWSLLFLEGIRVIMLTNWHFDILRLDHWLYAWNLWLAGWVIDDPKEWAFVLIILTFIPVWLTGWTALSMIHWGNLLADILELPLKIFKKLFENQVQKIAASASVKVVKKKKSYKEIRPRSIRPPLEDSAYALPADRKAALSGIPAKPKAKSPQADNKPVATGPVEFNHSLFQFDDDDNTDFDFDLFDDSKAQKESASAPAQAEEPQPAKSDKSDNRTSNRGKPDRQNHQRGGAQTSSRGSSNSTFDILKQKGYEIITGATIKNTLIDFIGVSGSTICLCLNDKEPGDWLADEERFNDEEPLWFSESSHRISPVRKIDVARNILTEKLSEANLPYKIEAFVIEQIGNIINAEDMFDIWDNMNINVTRIDRGTPKEIKLFAKTLEDADGKVDKADFEKIRKLIRGIA